MNKTEMSACLTDNYRALISYCTNLTNGHREDAEDLAHTTIVLALEHMDTCVPDNVRAWLCTIARNTYLNLLGKRKVKTYPSDELDEEMFSGTLITTSSENELESAYIQARASLSTPIRVVFELREYGFLYREIACILGIPIGTVKSRYFTAHQTIREYITGHDEE